MNKLYFKALKEYLGYSQAELKKIKDIVFDPPKVRYVVEVLEGISFVISKYDVIGDFFEGIVRGEFKQTKGQYLTHTNIIDFIIRALKIEELAMHLINEEKRLPFIIDPACGSGAFLIHSMKLTTNHVLNKWDNIKTSQAVQEFLLSAFPEYRRNAWAHDYVYGIEIHGDLAAATKVNMVGHGDGSANIDAKDSLMDFAGFGKPRLQVKKNSPIYPKPVNEQFDVVISNPPFSVTVDRDTARRFPDLYIQGEAILKKLKKTAKLEVATELLFIERWYQLLKPGGRLGVVLPESVFDTSANITIRLFLLKYFHIRAIISLPTLAFAPYTQTKTNLLFAQKKTEAEVTKWNELWAKYSEEYKRLVSKINKYFEDDPLPKPLWEIISSYEKKSFVLIDEGDFNNSYVNLEEKISDETNADIVQGHISVFLSDYLKDHTEEFSADLLKSVISRKRSFLPIVKEKIKIMQTSAFVRLLKSLLKHNFDEDDSTLSIKQLKEKYDEMIKVAKHDWWVFDEVAKKIGGNIFLAHAEEIGYKRGVRREEDRPNELFHKEGDSIIVNTEKPEKVLDYVIKNVKWR
jgi:type I restriction enzyme M protein